MAIHVGSLMACRPGSSCLTQVTFARLGWPSPTPTPHPPRWLMIRPQTSHRCPWGLPAATYRHSWVFATKTFLGKVGVLPGYLAPSQPWKDGRGKRK